MSMIQTSNERRYLEQLNTVLAFGDRKSDRTGTGTISYFGMQARYDLNNGFPLLTTKRVHFKSVVHELLWFLSGNTNVKYLQDNGVTIWDAWASENGELGPVYGKQWREWISWRTVGAHTYVDQIANLIEDIKADPDSRQHILTAWNVGELSQMKLQPCHLLAQFYVNHGKLSCQLYQRSADMFLGVPFNIASYALLTHMIAQVCGLRAGEFIHSIGDAHIYLNHVEQVKLQLSREPMEPPSIRLNPGIEDIDDFTFDDVELMGYRSHESINAEVAV